MKDEFMKFAKRRAWEQNKRHKFEASFEATQKQGIARHGMKFVKAQEAALYAGAGGLFEPFEPADFVFKARMSAIVLAVLDSQVTSIRHGTKVKEPAPC